MQDDFRPSKVSLPPTPAKTELGTPKLTLTIPDDAVDEQKIEQEFGPASNAGDEPPTSGVKEKMKKLLPKIKSPDGHKREFILLIIAIVILVAAAATSFMILQRQPATLAGIFSIHQKPFVPTTVASTLTGLQVDPSVNDRTVTAVMVENSLDARPQSSLDQAGVVFEALAEGGVTRFMALYQDSQPDYIGPVRSARPYYIQWLLGFDAAYAHVGGSPDALADIAAWHVKDLNEFYNSASYERISSRYAPHNVYTSIAQLNQAEASKNFGKSNFTGFTRKKDTPSKTPTASSITVQLSGPYYDSQYTYDPATNTYKRSESGEAHMELHKDGSLVQIAPKVVVTMIIPEHTGKLDSSGAYYADYSVIGSGQVLIFQDGVVQTGTWAKTADNSQITLTDAAGKAIALNAGQTWFVAVPNSSSNVTYK